MAKRSRKLSTKRSRRSRRSKSSSRKTMKRTKRQSSRKHTLKKHTSKKRKSRTKSVRKRKKTKKIMKGGEDLEKYDWYFGKFTREQSNEKIGTHTNRFLVRDASENVNNHIYTISFTKDEEGKIYNLPIYYRNNQYSIITKDHPNNTNEFNTVDDLIQNYKTTTFTISKKTFTLPPDGMNKNIDEVYGSL